MKKETTGVWPGRLRRRSRTAFSLVEMLAAVLLSGILMAAAAAAVLRSVRARQSAEAELAVRWERQALLEQFADDVNGMIQEGEQYYGVRMPKGDESVLELITLAQWPGADSAFALHVPARVQYYLQEKNDNDEFRQLFREATFLTEASSETEAYAYPLTDKLISADVAWHDGERWRDDDAAPASGARIVAVRLTCVWTENVRYERTVLIEGPNGEGGR